MDDKKLKIAIIFGGRSGEHEVSIVSAMSIMKAINKKKFDIIPVGITKQGKWICSKGVTKALKSGNTEKEPEVALIGKPGENLLMKVNKNKARNLLRNKKIDVVLPVLHGPYGEDGTIQGLLELANIPYVGAGVTASAVGMDKHLMKVIFQANDLFTPRFLMIKRKEWQKDKKEIIKRIEKTLKYPIFVKPASLGSSIGISKAHDQKELKEAIDIACQYDRKIMIEQGIKDAREIECSVLGNDNPKASRVLGEVIPCNEFYDYNAKYIDEDSKLIIPAKLPKRVINKIRKIAIEAYKAIDCAGMARVDFLIQKRTNKIYLSEINTIPGFTSISMYPKLWEASGLPYPKLIEKLIELALERHRDKNRNKTSYESRLFD